MARQGAMTKQKKDRKPNQKLIAMRLSRLSPSGSGRPLSREELADACNRILERIYERQERKRRWAGFNASYIGGLELGEPAWPNADYRAALREFFGSTDTELGFYIDRPDRAPEIGANPLAVEPSEHILHQGSMRAGGDIGAILTATDQVRRRIEDFLDRDATFAGKVSRLQNGVDIHAQDVLTVPPLEMVSRIGLDILDTLNVLQLPGMARTRELHAVLAKLAVLTADEMNVVGNVHAARAWYATAMAAADRSEVSELRADVCALSAMMPLYHGNPAEAVRLTQRARQLAGGNKCLANPLAPMLEALARASQGDRRRAKDALSDALRSYDNASDDVRSETAFGLSLRRRLFYEGRILTKISDYHSAGAVHQQALELYPEDVVGDRTIIKLDSAAALFARADPEHGAEVVSTALRALPNGHQASIFAAIASEAIGKAGENTRALPAVRSCLEFVNDLGRQSRASSGGQGSGR
ncbi:hypothetical protein Van01_62340 [Micromonospora andamanensis]|uniref:Tetratricopeptide repeat protein n=2 Tax=Micromonospora andamanensis TaxID=1287068 RepID=A0ABQ4I558_9ACTN|nr:hypothetical protein Van01_62340 [Micromonospora andamanensis]